MRRRWRWRSLRRRVGDRTLRYSHTLVCRSARSSSPDPHVAPANTEVLLAGDGRTSLSVPLLESL